MKFGYKVDVADSRDWKAGAKFGAGPTKRKFSLLDYIAPIRNQPAQNCVNEALSRAVHTVAAVAGTPIAYPSCLANYGVGRQLEVGAEALFLPDDGSFPRLVMQGARQFGMVPLAAYDDTEDPTEPVPFDVLTVAWHAKLTGFWRQDGGDEGPLCAAIEQGKPFIMGRTVGQDYLNLGTEIYDGRKGAAAGGHMECVVGYDLDAPVPYFEVVGSWGTGFARHGIAFCSIRSVMTEAYDKYVIDAAPRET